MYRVNRHVLEVGVGLWLLVDLQRVWAPSLITIFGQAASTPPELMGLFALAVVAAPGVLLSLLRDSGAHRRAVMATWCLVGALLARVVVQVVDGGKPQLWGATVGMVLALAWLSLSARHRGSDLLGGVFLGLAAASFSHAALGTWGAVWRDDAWAWGLLALQAALVGRAFVTREQPTDGPAPRMLCLALLPALLLAGIALANVGRASADTGHLGAALVAGTTAAAAGIVLWRPSLPRSVVVVDAAVLVFATFIVMYGDPGEGIAFAAAVGVIALAGVLMALVGSAAEAPAGGRDPIWALWAGGLVWVVLFFAYYAGYDLGYRADWLVVALAAVLAVAGVWAAFRDAPAAHGGLRRGARPAVALVAAAAVTFALAWVAPHATVRPVTVEAVDRNPGLTVMAWNLRMGYGTDGRFRVEEVAELIAEEAPDVVLLSEVDRGWLLNGGQDQLKILARLLDMEAHFGPAADPVWGDAILTAEPVRWETQPLPDFGAVTGAQIMAATVTKGGQEYDVLSTHLQPAGHGPDQGRLLQAQRIADFAQERITEGRPLILGGDFNLSPGTESWLALLDAGLDDGLADARPLFTSPADAPEEQIDHLFVSRGTWVTAAWAVSTQLSDHFPVLITVAPPTTV